MAFHYITIFTKILKSTQIGGFLSGDIVEHVIENLKYRLKVNVIVFGFLALGRSCEPGEMN